MPGPPGRWAEHTVAEEDAGLTVREVLQRRLGVSGRMIQRLTRSQGVLLNRRPAFLERRVRLGDVVTARLAGTEEPGLVPVAMPLEIRWEDRDVLVVDKPAGMLVHPTSAEHTRTLAHGVAHHLRAHGIHALVRPVHRIDRDTSGLVVFAKSAHAQAALDAQLRDHTMRRAYLALVDGVPEPESGTVDAPIGRHATRANLRAVRAGGEPARTHYRVVERLQGAALVELELETGRTHQVRVHMAHLGHPLLGDRWYGRRGLGLIGRLALHAHRVAFRAPSGEPVTVTAPLPGDLEAALRRLRPAPETSDS